MDADDHDRFWELRLLFRSPRLSARLFRHSLGACLLSPFVYILLAMVLGGPRYLADFPELWRAVIIACPVLLAFAVCAIPVPLLRRLLIAILIASVFLGAWAQRFAESDEALASVRIFTSFPDAVNLLIPELLQSSAATQPQGPPPAPADILDVVSKGAFIPWAATTANAEVYNDAVLAGLEPGKEAAADLAQYLRWTIPADVQRQTMSEAATMFPDASPQQLSRICHLSAIDPERQLDLLNMQSWDRFWSSFSAPAVFDQIQAYFLADLLNLGLPEAALLRGADHISPTDFDRLEQQHPCYYEFLLQRHPAARADPTLIFRILEIQDLSILELLPLASDLSATQFELAFTAPKLALDFAARTGRYDFILANVRKDPASFGHPDISRIAAFMPLDDYRALAVRAVAAGASPSDWARNSLGIPQFTEQVLESMQGQAISPRHASALAQKAINSRSSMIAVCELIQLQTGADLLRDAIPRSAAFDALARTDSERLMPLAIAILMHLPIQQRELVGLGPAPSRPFDRLLCASVKREAIFLTALFVAVAVLLVASPFVYQLPCTEAGGRDISRHGP
jgi:hypothetical protein